MRRQLPVHRTPGGPALVAHEERAAATTLVVLVALALSTSGLWSALCLAAAAVSAVSLVVEVRRIRRLAAETDQEGVLPWVVAGVLGVGVLVAGCAWLIRELGLEFVSPARGFVLGVAVATGSVLVEGLRRRAR